MADCSGVSVTDLQQLLHALRPHSFPHIEFDDTEADDRPYLVPQQEIKPAPPVSTVIGIAAPTAPTPAILSRNEHTELEVARARVLRDEQLRLQRIADEQATVAATAATAAAAAATAATTEVGLNNTATYSSDSDSDSDMDSVDGSTADRAPNDSNSLPPSHEAGAGASAGTGASSGAADEPEPKRQRSNVSTILTADMLAAAEAAGIVDDTDTSTSHTESKTLTPPVTESDNGGAAGGGGGRGQKRTAIANTGSGRRGGGAAGRHAQPQQSSTEAPTAWPVPTMMRTRSTGVSPFVLAGSAALDQARATAVIP
jgi:hypothetical protein